MADYQVTHYWSGWTFYTVEGASSEEEAEEAVVTLLGGEEPKYPVIEGKSDGDGGYFEVEELTEEPEEE